MPLDKILQALEAETERQILEIEQATQADIERIRALAQTEAEAVSQKHVAAIQSPLEAERARILNQAKLEALQIVMGTREAFIASALEATAYRLAALPGSGAYARLLQQLTEEVAATLGVDERLHLRVQSRDVALMKQIAVEKMSLSATVEGGLENEASRWGCPGGLVATTVDGRISLANTLEVRLQRVASLYRPQIAAMIFGERQEG